MKNVSCEANGIYVDVQCETAEKMCAIVELVTIMNHTIKSVYRGSDAGDHYATLKIYTGGDSSKQFANYVNNTAKSV